MAQKKGNTKNIEKKLIAYYAKLRKDNTRDKGVCQQPHTDK